MIRRSLRIGIRLGMLGGLAFAIFKIVQARRPFPAVPSGDDPWVTAPRAPAPAPAPAAAPSPAPAPAAAPSQAAEPDEPALVQPTMLQSTSLKRPGTGTGTGYRSFDPASTAPPVVAPANPFTPSAAAPATLVPPVTAEIEPDDDEIVILVTGDDKAAPAPDAPAVEVTSEAPVESAAASKAAAKKAAPKAGATKKAAPKKTAAKKAAAKKAAAKKTAAKKAAAKKAASKKAASKKAASKKAAAKKASARKRSAGSTAAWVDPDGGVCPTTHPVKAKLRSAIFHLPGMAAYARTTPDRCYRDEEAATDDGLRKAAR